MKTKKRKMKPRLRPLLLALCLLVGLMPANASAAQPTVTWGDVYRTTRTEAVVEFTSDTAGAYYYTAILPGEYSQDLKIDTSGEGIPCKAGEKVSVTVDGLTTDSYLFFLVVKSEDGTESEVMSVQIPEWDWWTLDEEGILHLEADKGLDNWKNWLSGQGLYYQMWYKNSVVGVRIWKDVAVEIDGGDFPASEYPNLAAYTVEDGNAEYCAEDGVLYNASKTWLEAYPGGKADTDFTVPDTVTSISSKAFYGNTKLKNITANKVRIVSQAFTGSAIETFSANAVIRIGDYAFNSCKKLTTVEVSGGESFYIDMNAFENCTSLTAFPFEKIDSTSHSVFKGCTSLTEIQVPKIIGNYMYSGCTGLTEITIPSTVTSVGESAFEGCTGLTSVTFESAVPPAVLQNAFTPVAADFRFHVPKGSENAYIEALGEDMAPYILDGSTLFYPLYVNGERIRSDKLEIICGDGTAVFDPDTNTLTLTDAAITEYGGKYGYGGAINSGLENLTIILEGDNTIVTEGDSINTGKGCNLVIKGGGTLTTNSALDLGREPGLVYDGNNDTGDLTIDGAAVHVGTYLFVHHDLTFKNGANVNITGNLTANHQSTLTVDGAATAVSANGLFMGNGSQSDQTESKLVIDGGTLTIREGVSIPYPEDGDTAEYAVRFYPKEEGVIEINGGTFRTQSDCRVTNTAEANITAGNAVDVKSGSWAQGPLLISEHTGVLVSEKVASCTQDGVKAHYECSDCNRWFEDEDCTVLIKDQSEWSLPATGHTPEKDWKATGTEHYQLCSSCQEELNKAAHTFEWVTDKPATEEETGIKHEECTVCQYKRNENTEIPKLDHEHTGIKHHEAVAATCTDTGNVEYWTCSSPKCEGKYYSNADCTNEIANIEIAADPDNHAGGTETRKVLEATCITDGYTGDTYCKGCGVKITSGTVIPATGEHTGGEWQYDEDGHWKNCTTPGCHAVLDEGEHESAYFHDNTNHWQACKVCGMTMDQEAAHTFGDWNVTKEATETEEGSKERECTVCGYKEIVNIPAAAGTKPSESSNPVNGGEPQTGDSSHILVWIALLVVSGGVFGMVTYKKKKQFN